MHVLYPNYPAATDKSGDLSAVFPLAQGGVLLVVALFAWLEFDKSRDSTRIIGIASVNW